MSFPTVIEIQEAVFTFSNGVSIINTTPHELTFLDGDVVVTVPKNGILLNAKPVEAVVFDDGTVQEVKTVFTGDDFGKALVEKILAVSPTVRIIGSIIAAQAYPGEVFAMTPAPGFERVPPAEKRMSTSKFTTF